MCYKTKPNQPIKLEKLIQIFILISVQVQYIQM